jgi:protoporphyrinogen oxidase
VDTSHDVIVIGAGLSGLTAARLLADEGRRVTVVDSHRAGGRASTDVRNEFRFNRGPHAIYAGGQAAKVLDGLGVDLAGGRAATRAWGSVGDDVAPLPSTPASLLRSPHLGWRGRLAIAGAIREVTRSASAAAEMTFFEWMDARRMPADARRMLSMLVRTATYSNSFDEMSADVALLQLHLALTSGVVYLHGGWSTMIDALLGNQEVRVETATSVSDDGGRVAVSTAQGNTLVAHAVVVAVGTPQAAASLLHRESFATGPAIEAACLDLAVVGHPRHSVLLALDGPLYCSDHGAVARLAPPGHSVVHVAKYLTDDEPHDHVASALQLHQFAALAGVGDGAIVEERYLHRMTVAGALPTPATGGLAGRPSHQHSGIANVALAGDWVGPTGHLADAAVASARAAATMLLESATLR